MNKKGFTFTESMVLIHLKEHPYNSLDSISEKLGISKNVISKALQTLEDAEIISWTPIPDQPIPSSHGSNPTIHGWIIKNKDDQL